MVFRRVRFRSLTGRRRGYKLLDGDARVQSSSRRGCLASRLSDFIDGMRPSCRAQRAGRHRTLDGLQRASFCTTNRPPARSDSLTR